MSVELGVWSGQAGGFIETGLWSAKEAAIVVDTFVREGEDRSDLEVLEVCPEHEDEPARDCQVCADDEDEERV